MKLHHLLGILVLLAMAKGCASMDSAQASTGPHEECLVCKMNFDLACIDVKVDDKTPRYMYQDKTYYFCSDECRDKFAKDPAKYLAK